MTTGNSYCYKGTEGFRKHAEFAMEQLTNIIQWGRDKGLNDPKAQLNKVIEEVGEIAHEITRNHYDLDSIDQPDELYDAIGDTLVTIFILADILNIDPVDCMSIAYDAIKDREGQTQNGTFVKND